MTLKKKLIIINSFIITVIVIICVSVMAVTSNYSRNNNTKEALINTVSKNANNLVTSDGYVYTDDYFTYYMDGVYLSLYTLDKTLINGVFPDNHESSLPLNKGMVSSYNYDNKKYYVYDYLVEIQGRDDIYLRGVIEENVFGSRTIFIASIILVPVLALFGIVIQIFVSMKATKPIEEIISKIDNINSKGDLTLRINTNTTDSDIKMLESSYNEMLKRLEDIFKREEQFSQDVSHELRTPLTVLKAECEYALSIENSQEKDVSMEIMHKQIDKMIDLVNELLAYARLAKNDSVSFEYLNISNLINEVKIINDKNITFNKNIEENVFLDVNEGLFNRLIQNLLDNAVKYNKENGSIDLELYCLEDNIYITIKDSGIGMDEKDIPHIFDRFYKTDTSRHNRASLGLGLSFVREIVRLHNGTIEVESKKDIGSTFKLTFIRK